MCLLGLLEVKAVTSFWFMAAGWYIYVLSLLINSICLVSLTQKSDDTVYTYVDKIPCAGVSQQLQTGFQFSFCSWLLKCHGVKAHFFHCLLLNWASCVVAAVLHAWERLSFPNTLEKSNDPPAALSVADEELFHLANRKFHSTNQNDSLPKLLWKCTRMEVRLSL